MTAQLRPFELAQPAVLGDGRVFNTPHLQWFRDLRTTVNALVHGAMVTPEDFGAIGDGVTDDTIALQAAFAYFYDRAGVLAFGAGKTYLITDTIVANSAAPAGSAYGPLVVEGNGATLLYTASNPANYPALRIQSAVDGRFDIVGAIAVGDTSFTCASAVEAAALYAGQWLFIACNDAALHPQPDGDCLYADWMQVASVAGAVVTVQQPFRTAFPGTHLGNMFWAELNSVLGVTIRDLTFTSTVAATMGLLVFYARNVAVENCRTNTSMDFWRTKNCSMRSCRSAFDGRALQGAEFAACVDFSATGNVFEFDGKVPDDSLVRLDMGCGFFNFDGNHLGGAADAAIYIKNGCHDGSVSWNSIGYVRWTALGPTGILGQGPQRVQFVGNTIAGCETHAGNSYGIWSNDDTEVSPTVPSLDNVFGPNSISNVVTRVSAPGTDLVIDPAGSALAITATTRSFEVPRLTTAQRNALTAAAGMVIFNTTTTKLETYDGATWQAAW